MSTEINTRGMIRAKSTSFPSGNETECLTKAGILATGIAEVNGSYGDYECPVIDDVRAYVSPLQYDITVKIGTTGIINLSGYISEICLVKTLINGLPFKHNIIMTVGEILSFAIVSFTFTGNTIEFQTPPSAPISKLVFTFNIDQREYTITVTTQ